MRTTELEAEMLIGQMNSAVKKRGENAMIEVLAAWLDENKASAESAEREAQALRAVMRYVASKLRDFGSLYFWAIGVPGDDFLCNLADALERGTTTTEGE